MMIDFPHLLRQQRFFLKKSCFTESQVCFADFCFFQSLPRFFSQHFKGITWIFFIGRHPSLYVLLPASKLQERELEKKAEKQAELKEEKRRIREKRRESDANAAREVHGFLAGGGSSVV